MGQVSASSRLEHTKLTITSLHGRHDPHAFEQSGSLDPAPPTSSVLLLVSPPPFSAVFLTSIPLSPPPPSPAVLPTSTTWSALSARSSHVNLDAVKKWERNTSGMAFYIYAVYKPKIPSYRVNGLEVKKFDVQWDFSLKTVFTVAVTADNPNTNIGFKYGKDSSVIVTYTDSVLCSGKLPSFHQGAENVTEMKIQLDGVSKFGSGLQEAFQESKDTGKIPLLVKVKAPVKVVIGSLSLREAIVYVNCSLVVDKLQPGKKVGIVKSNYSFDVSF
ncbi:unnamed protein product [Cuscuta campestris]|uniref:Uncharacterized protein n=1 Tax=Cuscuta campestris TaxID=132261 RepID=A0A484M3V8_9ASTE|nr:unnamed protein product [Cuscuta campestris]